MLNGQEIERLGIVRLADEAERTQVQPNGVDLSLAAVWLVVEQGALGVSNDDRLLPARRYLDFDANGWLSLAAGTYGIRYAEAVSLPADCGGLCFPRSSLLRMGVTVPTAVWDAGYQGRGEGLLIVGTPHGVRLQRGARIAQLVTFRLEQPAASVYAGRYQHENV